MLVIRSRCQVARRRAWFRAGAIADQISPAGENASAPPKLLPAVHQVAALAKRRLLGTHQGPVGAAAASGGIRSTLTCATSTPPGRLGAVSETPTWTTPATTSRPGRGCCPPNPIRRCDGTARSAAATAPRQAPCEAERRSHVRERSRRVQDATTMLNCCTSPRPRGLNESRSARPVVSERPCTETSRRWLAVTNVMVVF
jgi:hypothetical protein